MDLTSWIVFAHGGGLIGHEDMMFLLPTLPILLIGTIVVAIALQSRGILGPADRSVSLTSTFAAIAAGLSLGAAGIHFAVIQEHIADYFAFGLAFLGLAWFQAIWAQIYVMRRSAPLAILGAVINVGAVVVWLVSRTTGQRPSERWTCLPPASSFAWWPYCCRLSPRSAFDRWLFDALPISKPWFWRLSAS